MAENTRLRKLIANVRRILKVIKTRDREHTTKFETMESAIDTFLQHKAANPFQLFQVHNVKLDFLRFDGSSRQNNFFHITISIMIIT